jgi:hypothetical protein
MVKRNITTSIADRLYKIAIEKHIKWSDALRVGIIQLANVEIQLEDNTYMEKITQKHMIDKLQHANLKMQTIIQELNEKIGGGKLGNF